MNMNIWNNWKWHVTHRITHQNINDRELNLEYEMRSTPYYYSLVDHNNKNCPIGKQILPTAEELKNELWVSSYGINVYDSLAEEKFSPVPNLVHRYPDRVLLLVTTCCFVHCRFCGRKRLTSKKDEKLNVDEAIHYIVKHDEIKDVLISGGDPLTLEDEEIQDILERLRAINHVQIIRIGTRAPVVLPMRITDDLINILKKYHPLWINTHFNHPKEITEEAISACNKLSDAGIPLGNQSVLLKGINDNADTYKELCQNLIKSRIRPYYLYQCDLGDGISHFRTKVQVGIDIMEHLRQHITGFAIPTYVIDAPNGGGKIPINPNYIVDKNEERIIIRNYENKLFVYPETKNDRNSIL